MAQLVDVIDERRKMRSYEIQATDGVDSSNNYWVSSDDVQYIGPNIVKPREVNGTVVS